MVIKGEISGDRWLQRNTVLFFKGDKNFSKKVSREGKDFEGCYVAKGVKGGEERETISFRLELHYNNGEFTVN